MSTSSPARAAVRRTRLAVVAAPVVAGLALIGVLGHPHRAGSEVTGSAADGVVAEGTTVFDDVPAVDNLDPRLRHALRRAATDAAGDGVTFDLNSGWRSAAYQQRLLDQAIAQYGSKAAAARWVDTPATSETGEKLKADIDDLLDEIDEVLETNAEDFVRSYVQKGGE